MTDETMPEGQIVVSKAIWIAPEVSKVRAGDAEAGNNTAENGITGS